MRSDTGLPQHNGKPGSRKSASSKTHPDIAVNQLSLVETAGEIFPDGASIELIADPKTGGLSLLFTKGQTWSIGPRVEHEGRTYVPLNLDGRILRAVRFPHQVRNYASTIELFKAIRQIPMDYGFSEEVALIGTHFIFSSWFPDCVPAAPCLLIAGPKPEADLFFQLLTCLVRHPLQLVDFNLKSLSSLITIQPTLLFGQELLSASKLRLLFSANDPNSNTLIGGSLANFYSAKAIYQGMLFSNENGGNAMLRITLTPLRSKLPILSPEAREQIAGKFQPKLLNYRVRNIPKVRQSKFDLPWLSSGLRVLARIMGACIVDAREVQADLAPWFQIQQEGIREQNWLDERCVAIEVGFAYCHGKLKDHPVYVGEFAEDASTIFKARGRTEKVEPRRMGEILRSLGFSLKRNTRGYSFRLTDKTCHLIHRLAFAYDVAGIKYGKLRCQHCREILGAINTEDASKSEGDDDSDQ